MCWCIKFLDHIRNILNMSSVMPVKTAHMQSKYVVRNYGKLVLLVGVLLTSGLVLVLTCTRQMKFIIEKGFTLNPNSFAFNIWERNPMPLYLDFYLFNWTNPEDIHNSSIKPRFQEIGPIRFIETKEKVDITWNDNQTVSFRHMKKWYFDEEYSVVGLDVNITTLNPVSVSAAFAARHWGFWMKKGLQFSLGQFAPRLDVTKPIGEILFDGYDDVFVTLGNKFAMAKGPPMDKFGWFYTRNGSAEAEGYYNMDISADHLGEIRMWNYLPETQSYKGSCAKLIGSAGELYQRDAQRDNTSFYSSDLCRTVTLDYEEDRTYDGITGYKYVADKSFLDNGQNLPENSCFCNGPCIPYGVLNVSECKYGTPGFVSLPNFYKADPYYLNQVEGLKPDKDKHDFYINLEPTTGVPLEVAARLQLNLLLQPIKYISLFDNVPTVYFPVLWFEQVAFIPPHLTVLMKLLLYVPTISQTVGFLLIMSSVALMTYLMYKPLNKLLNHNFVDTELNANTFREAQPLNRIITSGDLLIKKKTDEYLIT